MTDTLARDFTLARYAYIQEQKKALNGVTLKVASLYQAILIALAASQFTVSQSLFSNNISASMATASHNALLVLNVVAAVTCISLIVGGIMSWRSYKGEEQELHRRAGLDIAKSDSKWSFLKWYETYIILTIMMSTSYHALAVLRIIPSAQMESICVS